MPFYIDRNNTVKFLAEHGIRTSKTALARMAMVGEGPKYIILRQKAYYTPEWLEEWLEQHLPSPSALEHMSRKGG